MLSPPTASEPSKPVQQASTEVIKTLAGNNPVLDQQDSLLNDKKGGTSGSGGSSSGGSSPSSTPDDAKSEKTADASQEKIGTKNDPVKKMYCN